MSSDEEARLDFDVSTSSGEDDIWAELVNVYLADFERRSEQGNKLSFIPASVWHIPKVNNVLYRLTGEDCKAARAVKRTGGALGPGGLRLSTFKCDVAERIIEYWSEPGDVIVDPFMGRATRGVAAALLGRHYVGYDVVPATVEWSNGVFKRLSEVMDSRLGSALGVVGDGCKLLDTDDESADAIFTCPPYWCLERYESAPDQLADCKTYDVFLNRLSLAAENCHRTLKAGGFSAIVVADFHRDGEFYSLHADVIGIWKAAGLMPWEVVIHHLTSPFVAISAGQNKRRKWVGKSHEYILVFKKRE